MSPNPIPGPLTVPANAAYLPPWLTAPNMDQKGAMGASLAQTRDQLHRLLIQRKIMDQMHAIQSHPVFTSSVK